MLCNLGGNQLRKHLIALHLCNKDMYIFRSINITSKSLSRKYCTTCYFRVKFGQNTASLGAMQWGYLFKKLQGLVGLCPCHGQQQWSFSVLLFTIVHEEAKLCFMQEARFFKVIKITPEMLL